MTLGQLLQNLNINQDLGELVPQCRQSQATLLVIVWASRVCLRVATDLLRMKCLLENRKIYYRK